MLLKRSYLVWFRSSPFWNCCHGLYCHLTDHNEGTCEPLSEYNSILIGKPNRLNCEQSGADVSITVTVKDLYNGIVKLISLM